MKHCDEDHLSRRSFLQHGTLVMAALSTPEVWQTLAATAEAPRLRIGLLTDVHYADILTAGTRCYRESLGKVREAVARFNQTPVDFTVELGDFIDAAATVEGEIAHLRAIEKEYVRLSKDRHYVLGNHCVWTLNKKQFFENCGAKKEYYSFDQGDFHFIVLDACYRQDGVSYGGRNNDWKDAEIPPAERSWLQADLESTAKPTLVFVHQRLDIETEHGVKSAPVVRQILEQSDRVLAVFQGHHHINDHKEIHGIHYCTLPALVDGSGANGSASGVLNVYADHSLRLEGFQRQKSWYWAA